MPHDFVAPFRAIIAFSPTPTPSELILRCYTIDSICAWKENTVTNLDSAPYKFNLKSIEMSSVLANRAVRGCKLNKAWDLMT